MAIYNGKQITVFDQYSFEYNKTRGMLVVCCGDSYQIPFCNKTCWLGKAASLPANTNLIKTLPENAVLYFDKHCKYPRFKSGESFKRCIKIEKATAIVITKCDKYDIRISDIGTLIDFDCQYVFVLDKILEKFKNLDDFVNQVIKIDKNLKENGTFKGVVYHGEISSFTNKAEYVEKILSGEYNKPIILAEDLDKVVNQKLPELDYEQLVNIKEMLNSRDGDVIRLGFNMLSGCNIDRYKLTLRLILFTNSAWVDACSGVAFKNVLNTLGITGWNTYNSIISGIRCAYQLKDTTEEDNEMAKRFVSEIYINFIKRHVQSIAIDDPRLPKVTINVE